MRHRLTLLQAPGGFGKTVLLAQCCRALRQGGVPVAWLSVDEDDSGDALLSHLAFAFAQAGVEMRGARGDPVDGPQILRPLMSAILAARTHCLLVVDDLERLRNRDAVEIMNLVLRAAPDNLHFALACRELPDGLDISDRVAAGNMVSVTSAELRFSTADIARFFDGLLSGQDLAAIASESAGWPIAVRMTRNAGGVGTGPALATLAYGQEETASWIERRLWRDLSAEDRNFVLDVSLFQWMDAELLDDALETPNCLRRLSDMESLAGLLQTTEAHPKHVCLHPLVREHAAARRFSETPARYRRVHRAAASALAERGHLVDALRHAAETGDASLSAGIALRAGGLHIWVTHGFGALRAAVRYLSAQALVTHPRIALMRSVVLAISGDLNRARRTCDSAAQQAAEMAPVSAKDAADCRADELIVRGMINMFACRRTGYQATFKAADRFAAEDSAPRSLFKLGHSSANNEAGRFRDALAWAERARTDLDRTSLNLLPLIDYQSGLACMALGRTLDADAWYRRGLSDALRGRLGDAGTILFGEIFLAELQAERFPGVPSEEPPPVTPEELSRCGAWFQAYTACIGVRTDVAVARVGLDSALALVAAACDFARRTARTALEQVCAALHVTLLATSGLGDEARRVWRLANLPNSDAGCLDIDNQRWRQTEALANARLDLLIACGDLTPARMFAADFLDTATRRNMLRMRMRALPRAMRLEFLAGDTARATEHLAEYVRLFRQADYAQSLAREREIALPLLHHLADTHPDSAELQPQVRVLIDRMTTDSGPVRKTRSSALNQAELDVLVLLAATADQRIADRLGLSYNGVRYRIGRIFEKLGVRNRHDAVHKARSLGYLPPGDDP